MKHMKTSIVQISLAALPCDIYTISFPLPPFSSPLLQSLKLRDGIPPPLPTHIPLALKSRISPPSTNSPFTHPILHTYISHVTEVSQRRGHNDHVHGGDERSAPRPAEVLVAVHYHVWVLVSCFCPVQSSIRSSPIHVSAIPPPPPPPRLRPPTPDETKRA
jgi:hypothetical protein